MQGLQIFTPAALGALDSRLGRHLLRGEKLHSAHPSHWKHLSISHCPRSDFLMSSRDVEMTTYSACVPVDAFAHAVSSFTKAPLTSTYL